jgi:hypothetical protein
VFFVKSFGRVAGEECAPNGVVAALGQVKINHLAEEFVGNLGNDPGPVPGAGVRSNRAAVFQVSESFERFGNNVVALGSPQGRDHGKTACVAVVSGVEQA